MHAPQCVCVCVCVRACVHACVHVCSHHENVNLVLQALSKETSLPRTHSGLLSIIACNT